MALPEDAKAAAVKAAAELDEAAGLERLEAAAAVAEAETAGAGASCAGRRAREHLDMDVAYCSHRAELGQVVKRAQGDAPSLGLVS